MRAFVASFAASLFMAGCNTASLTPRSDQDASCPLLVQAPCKAAAPSTGVCVADPASKDPLEARIANDAGYAVGCLLYVPELPPDDQGQCTIDGTCRCDADGGAPRFTCTPPSQ